MKSIFSNRNKQLSTILALSTCLVIILTGTFAWRGITDAVNEFGSPDSKNPGGSLHDDFEEPNKDVYIENWGDIPIFVRIKLDEYMEIGEGSGKYAIPPETVNPDNHAVSILPGALLNVYETWFTHAPENGDVTICGQPFHDYFSWVMGGQKYYLPAQPAPGSVEPPLTVQNPAEVKATDPGAKLTLKAGVITMDEWKNAFNKRINTNNENDLNYWVYDTDGWAYWVGALAPGKATGLLLDAVNTLIIPDESHYYAIHVIAQMASKNLSGHGEEFGNWKDFGDPDKGGWTADGEDLMELIVNGIDGGNGGGSSGIVPDGNGKVIGDDIYVRQGDTVVLTADDSITGGTADNTDWTNSVTPPSVFTDNHDNTATLEVGISVPVGTSYDISASAKDDPSKSDSKRAVVIPSDAKGVVVGGDGELYIDYGDNTFRKFTMPGGSLGQLICGMEDLTPGTADDRHDVVIGSDGVKYLGPDGSNGDRYRRDPIQERDGFEGDNLLGTGDDIYVWKINPNVDFGNDSDNDPSNGNDNNESFTDPSASQPTPTSAPSSTNTPTPSPTPTATPSPTKTPTPSPTPTATPSPTKSPTPTSAPSSPLPELENGSSGSLVNIDGVEWIIVTKLINSGQNYALLTKPIGPNFALVIEADYNDPDCNLRTTVENEYYGITPRLKNALVEPYSIDTNPNTVSSPSSTYATDKTAVFPLSRAEADYISSLWRSWNYSLVLRSTDTYGNKIYYTNPATGTYELQADQDHGQGAGIFTLAVNPYASVACWVKY
ncbi:MAG: hypothetical protein LBU32_20510 [Clostridiales bacterium]|jgi:cell division septation protein DedD|nr:hypothetical protein [Clostridiales bacterium]